MREDLGKYKKVYNKCLKEETYYSIFTPQS